jgi:hypothetical protein
MTAWNNLFLLNSPCKNNVDYLSRCHQKYACHPGRIVSQLKASVVRVTNLKAAEEIKS